jgi:hypothetical protein
MLFLDDEKAMTLGCRGFFACGEAYGGLRPKFNTRELTLRQNLTLANEYGVLRVIYGFHLNFTLRNDLNPLIRRLKNKKIPLFIDFL